MYNTDETLEGSKTFIQQGHINLMKNDSKDIYNDTKKTYFELSIHQRIINKCIVYTKKILRCFW